MQTQFFKRLLRRNAIVVVALLSLTASARASSGVPADIPEIGVPPALKDVGIVEKPGTSLLLKDLTFKDETGATVPFAKYFHQPGTAGEKPVVLVLAYYECPNLCTFVLNGLKDSLKGLDWTPGKQFEVVTVSIDPRETPELAAAKKAAYVKALGKPEAAAGWHFLTGEESQIRALSQAVGFNYKWIPEDKQFAHSAAIYVATPDGRLSRYLYGIEYKSKDLRLALLEASNGKIGTVIDRLLLFCYHYNPQTRKYSVYVTQLMQAGGAGTVVVFGGYMIVFWRRQRRPKKKKKKKGRTSPMVKHLNWILAAMAAGFAHASAFAGDLPLQGTDIAARWDNLYNFLVWLSVFFFVLVVGTMLYFAYAYRSGQPGRKTKYITGNHLVEGIWIAVPTVLLMIIFGWGFSVYHGMIAAPTDAYEIKVIAKQWLWQFQYDNGKSTTGELYVPMNRPVRLLMTSEDVLHSFFVPNFRVKQDVVPGMYTSVWFEAKVPGKHQVFCAEYCGTSHSGMLAKVIVLDEKQWKDWNSGKKLGPIPNAGEELSQADIDDWKRQQGSELTGRKITPVSLAMQGRSHFETKGCASCHTVDGSSKIGPSMKGLFGSRVALTDGSSVTADENYLRESIELPQAKLVSGFSPTMPTFRGQLNPSEINALVAYIKTLK